MQPTFHENLSHFTLNIVQNAYYDLKFINGRELDAQQEWNDDVMVSIHVLPINAQRQNVNMLKNNDAALLSLGRVSNG